MKRKWDCLILCMLLMCMTNVYPAAEAESEVTVSVIPRVNAVSIGDKVVFDYAITGIDSFKSATVNYSIRVGLNSVESSSSNSFAIDALAGT